MLKHTKHTREEQESNHTLQVLHEYCECRLKGTKERSNESISQ